MIEAVRVGTEYAGEIRTVTDQEMLIGWVAYSATGVELTGSVPRHQAIQAVINARYLPTE